MVPDFRRREFITLLGGAVLARPSWPAGGLAALLVSPDALFTSRSS
jgi:hypothetical protein